MFSKKPIIIPKIKIEIIDGISAKEEDFKISNIFTGKNATICLRIRIVKAMDSANVQIKSAVKACGGFKIP